jgi:hypothetical protein
LTRIETDYCRKKPEIIGVKQFFSCKFIKVQNAWADVWVMPLKWYSHIIARIAAAAAFIATVAAFASPAQGGIVSYSAATNLLPADPPFRYIDTSGLSGPAVDPTISNGVASLGMTSVAGLSFWYTDVLTLDHNLTVDVTARLKLDSESSNDPTDAAGLAIAVSNDQDLYQNLFLNANGVFFSKLNSTDTGLMPDTAMALDTTQWHTYQLQIQGSSVTLSVDGTQELTSSLFNLSATRQFVLPDYVAVGDISPVAQSQFDLTSISVSVVPEPSYAAPIMIALAMIVALRSRSHKRLVMA